MGWLIFVARFVIAWIYNWWMRLFTDPWDVIYRCEWSEYVIHRNGVMAHKDCDVEKLRRMQHDTDLLIDDYKIYADIGADPHTLDTFRRTRFHGVDQDYKQIDSDDILCMSDEIIDIVENEKMDIPDDDDNVDFF